MARISVIISAYNAENTIAESIQSVINQSFKDWILLISDDGSTDRTREIIDSFTDSRIQRYHNNANKHVCWTWNKLLSKVKTEFVTFQDADDISYRNRLEILMSAAVKFPDHAIIGANHLRPLDRWCSFTTSNFLLTDEQIRSKVYSEGKLDSCGPRSLFHVEAIKEFQGFRELFPRCGWEDFDLILRIMQKHKIMNLENILYEYRYMSNSYSRINKTDVSVEKLFIQEIGINLLHERKKCNGVDSLMLANKDSLEEILTPYRLTLKSEPSLALRKKCMNLISNKDYFNAYKTAFNAFILQPFVRENMRVILKLIMSHLTSIILYPLRAISYSKKLNYHRE